MSNQTNMFDQTNYINQITQETFCYLGGIISIVKVTPQIIKFFKTKSAKDLSIIFIMLGICGGIFLLIYEPMLSNIPIILQSLVILVITILV